MPFTPSHAIAVLPLPRRLFVLPALIVGSMTPDFEYLLRLSFQWHWGHFPAGILVFGIPAGLVVLWLYFSILQFPLLVMTPAPLRRFIRPLTGAFAFGPPLRFARIVFSIAVGALTHIAWDSFTHADGFAVRHLAALAVPVAMIGQCQVLVCHVLQHVCSAIGLAVIVILLLQTGFRSPPAADEPPGIPPLRAFVTVAAVSFAAFLLAVILHMNVVADISDYMTLRNAAGLISLTWMTIVTIAWFFLGLRSLAFMDAMQITREEMYMNSVVSIQNSELKTAEPERCPSILNSDF